MAKARKDPVELLEKVNDRESFLTFVKALIADREDEVRKDAKNPDPWLDMGSNGWQNHSIESYFESAVAWYESTGCGEPDSEDKPVSPWRHFTYFLYAGKIYE